MRLSKAQALALGVLEENGGRVYHSGGSYCIVVSQGVYVASLYFAVVKALRNRGLVDKRDGGGITKKGSAALAEHEARRRRQKQGRPEGKE